MLLVNKDTDGQSPVVYPVPPVDEDLAYLAIAAAQADQNVNPQQSASHPQATGQPSTRQKAGRVS